MTSVFFGFFCFFFKWILCWNDEWSRLWPFHCIHITVFNDASWFTLTDCCCCWVFMLHLPNVVYLYCCSKNALNGSKNVFCFVFLSGFWEMSSDDVNAFSTSHLLFLSWDVLWVHCVPSIIQSLFLSFCLSTLQWIKGMNKIFHQPLKIRAGFHRLKRIWTNVWWTRSWKNVFVILSLFHDKLRK